MGGASFLGYSLIEFELLLICNFFFVLSVVMSHISGGLFFSREILGLHALMCLYMHA